MKNVIGATLVGITRRVPSLRIVEQGRMRRKASPTDGAREAKLVEDFRIVVRDAASENLPLPGVGRCFVSLKLAQSFESAALAEKLSGWGDVLPAQQPAHELRRVNGLNFVAQLSKSKAVNSREQAAIAPFGFGRCRVGEFSA